MTAPLRTFLLNGQISIRARQIAHQFTSTCKDPDPDRAKETGDQFHTNTCNQLKHEIEQLCLQIKLAAIQPPRRP